MTRGDLVGCVDKPCDVKGDCACCQRPMPGFDGKEICRWYGKPPGPALAEDCTQFVPAVAPWFQGAWVCDSQGRGD